MTEFSKFIAFLKKKWYILIAIPLVAIVVTFFMVRNLPDEYLSHIRIATGLIDRSDAFLKASDNEQESKINQQFGNLIQLITTRKVINQVSYATVIHDFTKKPFKKPSKDVRELNAAARQHLVEVCSRKYEKAEELSMWDTDEKGIQRVIASLGYNYPSIVNNLSVFRVGSSDFIDADFTSSNPELSAFVVNSLASEFLTYYNMLIRENQSKAINFLDSLVRQKELSMNAKMQELKNYKIRNRILNLQEQAKSIYGQIAEFETKREMAAKDISAYSAALSQINSKFNPKDRRYIESALINVNQKILSIRGQLQSANNEYIQSGFDTKYKGRVDSLQNYLTTQIAQSTDLYIYNPLATKENLVNQKLTLEVSLDLAKNSVSSLDSEVNRLSRKIDRLVPNEASIQAYESDIDIASKEYIELLGKYNQTSLESSFAGKLRMVEVGMPGEAKPSKKLLLVALAGIVSLVLCVVVLFILFYLDDTIKDAEQLANETGMAVLGCISKINEKEFSYSELWSNENTRLDQQALKNNLRSLRFEIEQELNSDAILGIVSLSISESATFVSTNLAYAYAAINKKVLLINGNFIHTRPSNEQNAIYLENFLKSNNYELNSSDNVTVLANKGGDYSLLELADQATIKEKFKKLRNTFDLIIIDMGSFDQTDKAKEWILFAKTIIGVINVNTVISKQNKTYVQYLGEIPDQFKGWVLNKVETTQEFIKKRNKSKQYV